VFVKVTTSSKAHGVIQNRFSLGKAEASTNLDATPPNPLGFRSSDLKPHGEITWI